MLRSRSACWMADRSICKRLFYTTAGARWIPARVETGLAPSRLRPHALWRLILKRIEGSDLELLEVPFIPGRHNQTMDPRRRGDHGVLQQLRGPLVHNAAPFPKARRIHREHLIGRGQPINPTLDLARFRWILTSCPLDARLQFTQCDGGEYQPPLFHSADPGDHRSVAARFPQFRDYVRIEQVLIHSNSSTGRLRNLRLSKIRSSKRGSRASNHSLRPGLAAFWSLSHSSIGTRTAALTPRRVTTCGPFLMAASSNSLKRAFASCTCQEANSHLDLLIVLTSHMTSQIDCAEVHCIV